MDIESNRLKANILAGQLQLGLWCSLASPVAADIVADAGFDWLMFDTEHSPLEVSGVLPLLQAARGGTASAVVRPAWNDPVLIKRVLDLGAQTLIVPYVQNAGEARNAVSAVRYAPQGIRGVTASGRASRYGRVKGYFADAAREICLIVQVETRAALGELEAIAAVDGVNVVFIGPADLAASLGRIGNPSHPEVQDALRNAIGTLKTAGKPAGILTANGDEARRYIEWGYTFVGVGSDVGLLAAGGDALARTFRETA